jgi:hypothetical protein
LVATTFAGALSPTLSGIVASIWVLASTVSPVAGSPSNSTCVVPDTKFVPMIVTSHSSEAALGVTDVMVGATAYAGVARPSTSRATATPTAATRRPMCRLTRVMSPSSLSASTSSRLSFHATSSRISHAI